MSKMLLSIVAMKKQYKSSEDAVEFLKQMQRT
jgi:hypothetical protein